MTVTLNLSKESDWAILLPLLKRLDIDISIVQSTKAKHSKKMNPKILQKHLNIIEKGGDASYFGDASEWQRQERQERNLPFPFISENEI